MTNCDECGGFIDPLTFSCTKCGLEIENIEEVRFTGLSGHRDSRMGIVHTTKRHASDWKGFGCPICYEWFSHDEGQINLRSDTVAHTSGHDLGSSLIYFRTKMELRDHIRVVHNNKRPRRKYLSRYRLTKRLIKKTNGGNLLKKNGDE